MLSKSVQDAINEQIKHELYSAYLYLSMSAHFETANLPGFANWMRVQSQEETLHAMIFFDYVNERGGRVVLHAIDQPPAEFGSPLSIAQQVLEHEQKVTSLIHQLYALAVKENDYPSQIKLQWFVTEQVEEEKNADEIIQRLKMVGDNLNALLVLDRELAQRPPVITVPATPA
ncbi:MAG: ferritin [Thermoflexales bacterium]|nr:ferritin [Thermoflexales bacterium]